MKKVQACQAQNLSRSATCSFDQRQRHHLWGVAPSILELRHDLSYHPLSNALLSRDVPAADPQ